MKIASLAAAAIAAATSLVPSADAQVQTAWTFGYDLPSTLSARPSGVAVTADGALIAGQIVPVPNQSIGTSVATITRFSENGDRDWEVVLPPNSGSTYMRADVAVAPSGQVYAGIGSLFSGAQVVGISADGDQLWEVQVSGNWVCAVDTLPGGDVIAATYYFTGLLYPYLRLYRINPAGQIVWQVDGPQLYTAEMIVAPDGRIAVMGPEDWLEEYQWGVVAVYTPDGVLEWSSRAPADGSLTSIGSSAWYEELDAAAFGASGSLYVATFGIEASGSPSGPIERPGFAYHAFTTTGQRTAWTITSGSGAAYPESIAVDESQDAVYIAGWDADCETCERHAAVWCFDLAGQQRWLQRVGPAVSDQSRALSVTVTSDGLAVVSGVAEVAAPATDVGFHRALNAQGQIVWSIDDAGDFLEDRVGEFSGAIEDARGNLFVQHHASDGIRFRKLVPGGPVGTITCGPAAPNSTGAAATLRAIGSDEVATNNVSLVLSSMPANTFAMVISGRSTGSVPVGQGTLCLGPGIGRYDEIEELRRTRADGTSAFQLDLDALQTPFGSVPGLVGETWFFQAWYRDVNPGATSNLTDAVGITLR